MPPKKKSETTDVTEIETPDVEPVDAAADEATDADLVIPWRGTEVKVDREVLTSARFLLALRTGANHVILAEILGPENFEPFLSTLKRGEQMPTVAAEFLEVVSSVAGWGNSQPS